MQVGEIKVYKHISLILIVQIFQQILLIFSFKYLEATGQQGHISHASGRD